MIFILFEAFTIENNMLNRSQCLPGSKYVVNPGIGGRIFISFFLSILRFLIPLKYSLIPQEAHSGQQKHGRRKDQYHERITQV